MRVLRSMMVVCALGLGSAFAQQDEPVDLSNAEQVQEASSETRKAESKMNIEAIRTRLEASIKKGEAQLERNREALRRLEEGESPVAVLRAVRMREPRVRQVRSEGREPRQQPKNDSTAPSRAKVEEVKAFLAEHLPEIHTQIEILEAADKAVADRLTMRLAPKIEEIIRVYHRDKVLGELKVEELRSGLIFVEKMRRYRNAMKDPKATEDQQASALAELRLAAEARFDARMKLREYEVTKLTEQLLALSKAMVELRESRDAEIDQMIAASQSASKKHRDHARRDKAKNKRAKD